MKKSQLACDMSAFESSEREKHIETTKAVFSLTKEIKEISNGYGFQFPNESSLLMNLMTFIDKERLCCPFFGFIVEVEPEGGNVWLEIFGQDGVKEVIEAEFGDNLKNKIQRQ
jgi:hypothetical protein